MQKKTSPRNRTTQGFTLIELLIVIAIIGILSAVLLPSFFGAQKRPHDVAALQCGRAVVAAQTVHFAEAHTYAANIDALGEDVAESCGDVQISDSAGAQQDDGNGGLDVSGNNWAFFIWHKNGSKVYAFDKDAGIRFRPE